MEMCATHTGLWRRRPGEPPGLVAEIVKTLQESFGIFGCGRVRGLSRRVIAGSRGVTEQVDDRIPVRTEQGFVVTALEAGGGLIIVWTFGHVLLPCSRETEIEVA